MLRKFAESIVADERRSWKMLAGLCAVLAFLKGIRLPNLWSATQSQLDYSGGFIRRGLFGELLDVARIHRYAAFASLSLLLLLGLWRVLWRLSWSGKPVELTRAAGATVFFSSFAFSYLASLIGYLDIALGLMTVGVLLVRQTRQRMVLAVLLATAGILIHELFVFVFLPVLLFSFLADAVEKRSRSLLLFVCMLAAGAAVGTLLIARAPSVPAGGVQVLERHIGTRVDFPVRGDLFDVLARSARDNLTIMGGYAHSTNFWVDQVRAASAFLPSAVFFFLIARRSLLGLPSGRGRTILMCGAAVASAAPLLMNVFGWDVYRWWALVALDAFLTMIVAGRITCGDEKEQPAMVKRLAIVLVALNMATGIGLMDGYAPRNFPYAGLARSWGDFLRTGRLVQPSH